jgi:hypothetical protein
VDIISKVERAAVRRSLHRMVRPHLGCKYWGLSTGNLYVPCDQIINSLSLESETELQANIVTASELRIAKSPRGIRCSGNVM